jgi:diguanylate cyclase (GGDEF)-like protein
MSAPAAPSLDRQALLDLMQRARGGIAIHLILWLLIGWSSALHLAAPLFFAATAALFAANMVARLIFEPRIATLSLRRPLLARGAFLVMLLGSPAQWGLLSVAAMLWPVLAPAEGWIWFTLTGVAASGGMSLAIDPLVRHFYAPLAAVSPLCAMLWTQSSEKAFPAVATVVFLLYIHRASGVVHADYWAAAHARAELEKRAEQLEAMSCTDALTQVANRMQFDRQVGTEWRRRLCGEQTLSVMMIDVDHFKRVNDRFGHAFGDACLQAVAAALQSGLQRPGDLLARYGGEEFAVILPSSDSQGAAAVAERLRQSVAALSFSLDGQLVRITCSIGVHTVDSVADTTPGQALARADQALYRAKQEGRDRVVVAAPAEVNNASSTLPMPSCLAISQV